MRPHPESGEVIVRTPPPLAIAPPKSCDLPELIDLAEHNNPQTGLDWEGVARRRRVRGWPRANGWPRKPGSSSVCTGEAWFVPARAGVTRR